MSLGRVRLCAMVDEFLIPGTSEDIAQMYRTLPERAKEGSFTLFEDEVVILDTETTGLDYTRCALLEIAAVRMAGPDIVDRFETFVDPGCSIPEEITELTGITQSDISGAPAPQEAVAQLAEFAGTSCLVAHNASFDREFVMREARPGALCGAWIDTVAFAQIVLPRLKSHRLADLARAFDVHAPTHRSMDDVISLAGIWRILLSALHSMTPGLAAAIAELSPHTEWPLRPYFLQAAQANPGIDFSLRRIRAENVQAGERACKQDADEVSLHFASDADIEEAFSEDGVAATMYSSYEQRAEQVAMAKEVMGCLREGDFRVLEAGTGVGKSMAYLLPCALTARQNNITAGIATKTNALMDQLVYHELPRLASSIDGLAYIALKGYEHYPCLRKIERITREENDVAVIQMTAMLLNFIAQTQWGDLDAMNLHWAGLPREAIQANPHDCLKKRCPYFPRRCYLHGARRTAASADIVVTNHALLFRDIQADNGILPPIRNWVIDEAHSVEQEARRQLSHSVSIRDLDALLNQLAGGRASVVAQIRAKVPKLEGGDMLYGVTADIENRADSIRASATLFFACVKTLETGDEGKTSAYSRATVWISEKVRESSQWQQLKTLGAQLADKLEGLCKRLSDLVCMAEEFEGVLSTQAAELSGISSDLFDAQSALSLVLDGADSNYVYFAQLDRDPSRLGEALGASKLDIGETLADIFFPQVKSIVFTSATLASGSGEPFAHFLETTGLSRMPQQRVSTKALASSYDFDHAMTVFLPSDMPEPTSRDYRASLAGLLREVHLAMGGSVLTLFTNRREMEALYRELKPQLAEEGIGLVAQTKGTSTKALRDRFLANNDLSLFALKSFWEGFDAPGDTLRCVIITKLPFGRPTDPIAREREARESRAAWRKYSLPEAVIDVKQAAGRLIRNSTDSGWLVLADARLQTKGYGKSFLRVMPTSDIRTCTIDEIADTMRNETPGLNDCG